MKILHVVGGNLDGGAAKGALLLHEALLDRGVHSRIFTNSFIKVNSKFIESSTETSLGHYKSRFLQVADHLPSLCYINKPQLVFSNNCFGLDIRKSQEFHSSDVIHLHWINLGMIRLSCLSKINKPIVWTLRDMWAMTGGCHHALECEKYKSKCGRCIQLNSKNQVDLSRFNFNRKKKYFPDSMNIVGVSSWISNCAKESTLLRRYRVNTIHNGIDTDTFTPAEKLIARNQLGLPLNKKILLIGSQSIDDPYKGFKYFEKSFEKIKSNFYLTVFGRDATSVLDRLPVPAKNLGYIDCNQKLRLVYSAADVFVAPSAVESFGKTIAEALACGTPVVCFDTSGQSDIVEHKVTGFKAMPFDTTDFARGIDWVVANEDRHQQLCLMARQRAKSFFDINLAAQRYQELYESIV